MGALTLAKEEVHVCALDTFQRLSELLMSDKEKTRPLHEIEGDLFGGLLELGRKMLQEHLDARGDGDVGDAIVRDDGVLLNHKRGSRTQVTTVFGKVGVQAQGYGQRGEDRLFPMREQLQLTARSFSYYAQKMSCREAVLGPYERVTETLEQYTGAHVAKQQVQQLVCLGAEDFESFYTERACESAVSDAPIIVVQADHKGIVMRKDDLRDETKKRAVSKKLKTRVSKGEKKNRKRMSAVVSVYDIEEFMRTPDDVLDEFRRKECKDRRPKPINKRLWASVEKDTGEVLEESREEVSHRVTSEKAVVFLSDGERKLKKQAKDILGGELIDTAARFFMIVDIIHVIEYLWKAAHVFFEDDDLEREVFVCRYLRMILEGRSGHVRTSLAQLSRHRELDGDAQKVINGVRTYLKNNGDHMHYDIYLSQGLPISTGVIEGACKTLVKDRFEITGARWSLAGAEALLKLRSIYQSGDWDAYWDYHVRQEQARLHPEGRWKPVNKKERKLKVIEGGKSS